MGRLLITNINKNMDALYTDNNIFEEDIVQRYEDFVVDSLDSVKERFGNLLRWVNEKIVFPNLLWREKRKEEKDKDVSLVIPVVNIIDFGVGSGKFTIPHIRSCIDMGLHVRVIGFDKSKVMLDRFKKNAKSQLNVQFGDVLSDDLFGSFENKDCNRMEEACIENVTLYKMDLNEHDKIGEKIQDFLKGSEDRIYSNLCCFAQVWHYLKNPKEFLENVLIGKLKGSYILHYEPIYYFKLWDGTFDQGDFFLDFSQKDNQLHREFWMYYFSLRDRIRAYSNQPIKGSNIDRCLRWYKERKFIYIGRQVIEWRKNLDFFKLIEIIKDPIISSQYVGLNRSNRKDLAKKMEEAFKEQRENFKKDFKFGYIVHLLSTKGVND